MFKVRPKIRLLAPPQLIPGQRFVAEAIVKASRPLDVRYIDMTLECTERGTLGSGNSQYSRTASPVRLRGRVVGKTRLEGTQHFRCSFTIPGDAPPSYRGSRSTTTYMLTVHASIPWWLDAKPSYVLNVGYPPSDLQPTPGLYSTNPAGPKGTEPHAEVSLASTQVVSGKVLKGAVALSNISHARYHGLRLELVGLERITLGSRSTVFEAFDYHLELPLASTREGQAIPFRMRLPDVPPTHASRLRRLDWVLRVRAKRRLARDVVVGIPVTLLPAGSASKTLKSARAAPPALGSERIRKLWQHVASELGLRLEDDALHFETQDVSLRVERQHRGASGIFLVGDLRFPSLGLGLDGGVIRGFQRYFGSKERVDWPAGHYFTGRELAQVRAFAEALLPGTIPFKVADASDEHLQCELRDSGQTYAKLLRFAYDTKSLAEEIPAARAAIVPPARFSPAVVRAWKRLAKQLGGRLELGDMSIRGSFEEHEASVVTEWSDEDPILTRITLVPNLELTPRSQHRWNAEDGRAPGSSRKLGAKAEKLLQALQADALAVDVEKEALRVALPAPLSQPLTAGEWLARLVQLELTLRKRRGPYR